MPGSPRAKLIVPDTGPPITLAVADCLDYLLYPGVPIHVPDAVLYEATVRGSALGAASIAAWVQDHPGTVLPVVTTSYTNFLTIRDTDPLHRERDLGERAAIEAIRYGIRLDADERAVLVTEDDRVLRGAFIVPVEDRERVITITSADLLAGLEAAGRINSAEEVYRRAEAAGRRASRAKVLDEGHRGRGMPSPGCFAGLGRARPKGDDQSGGARRPSLVDGAPNATRGTDPSARAPSHVVATRLRPPRAPPPWSAARSAGSRPGGSIPPRPAYPRGTAPGWCAWSRRCGG